MMAHLLVSVALTLACVCEGMQIRRDDTTFHREARGEWFNGEIDFSTENLNFRSATQVHSNLGGHGPDSGLEAIVYDNIGTHDGQKLDLIIEAVPGTDVAPPANPTDENSLNSKAGLAKICSPCGTVANLIAHIVKSGTWRGTAPFEENEVVLPRFFYSVLDFDAAKYKKNKVQGLESVTISPVAEYYVGSAVDVAMTGSKELTFTATEQGVGADNPTDAFNLTEEQMSRSVMVVMRGVSRFNLTFSTTAGSGGCGKSCGRCTLFAGPSATIKDELGVCEFLNMPEFVLSSLSVNNLDGSNPNQEAIMLFDNVTVIEGKQVDLAVKAMSGNYQARDPAKNLLGNGQGQINVDKNLSVVFRFSLLSEGKPFTMPVFFFSFWDIDGTLDNFETVTMLSGHGTYFLSPTTQLSVSNLISGVKFTGSEKGIEGDNPPLLAGNKTQTQLDQAVLFYFDSPVSTFDVEFGTNGFGRGRNFAFSGYFPCQ